MILWIHTSHLLFGLVGLSVEPIQILLVNYKFFVDSLGCDHSLSHCYTVVISIFTEFFVLSSCGNLFIDRPMSSDHSHCLNALLGFCEYFPKEIFNRSSHFVTMYSNFFVTDTYVCYETINSMCGHVKHWIWGFLTIIKGKGFCRKKDTQGKLSGHTKRFGTPVMNDLGEGVRQKILIHQFFNFNSLLKFGSGMRDPLQGLPSTLIGW